MPRKINKTTKKPTAKKRGATIPSSQQPEVPMYVASSVQLPAQTESQRIWEEIRYRPIEMFALPNQIVEQHCTPFPVDPHRLFLTVRSTATLPSLEVSCGKDFVVELADKYVIVTRQQASISPPKK